MTSRCKHGLDPRFCAECQKAIETEPLPPDALRLTLDGKPGLVLRMESGSENATALVLEGAVGRIVSVACSAFLAFESMAGFDRQQALEQLHTVALGMGYLFHPERALTLREQTEEGPTHCYECKTELSLEKGSLGCRQCQYYVCRCGRCLCGYTGRNYQGDLFTQSPPLPISRKERLEFVRVVRFCAGGTYAEGVNTKGVESTIDNCSG